METIAPLLDCLNSGTADVFSKMLGWKIENEPGNADFEMPMRMFGVTGAVSLAGKLTGVVYINLSDSFAEQVARQILGETLPIPAPDVNDVVGELANMISGNIKSKMSDRGYPCRLSIPTVMRGSPVLIDTQPVPIQLGSRFHFQLIRKLNRAYFCPPRSKNRMIPPKILSVDDSKMIHRVIDKAFKPFECEMFFASNGQEGLAAAARELPNVIVLDITMPVMDGFETLARLKADPTLKNIPVIMLTAEAGTENVLKIARMGVRDYVVKPFTDDALLDRVKRFVTLSPKAAAESAPKKLDDALKLLVLDDKPAIIEAVRAAVGGRPWSVIGFTDGKEAATQAVKEAPDLALVSLSLPNRMPLNFLQVLRANASTQRLPILGLSLETEVDEQSDARRAGFAGIVTKPIQSEDLVSAIMHALKIVAGSRYFHVEDSIHYAALPSALSASVTATIRREFDEMAESSSGAGAKVLILDASALVQADVLALELILALLRGCEASKTTARIVGSPSFAQQARGITETANLVFYPSRAEALASINLARAA